MFTNFITSNVTFLKKNRLLLHSYESTLHEHRKFYVDLHFLCLAFTRNLCPGVIAYPWGLLAGNPINKGFPHHGSKGFLLHDVLIIAIVTLLPAAQIYVPF